MQSKTVSVYGYGRFGKLWADILAEEYKVKVFSRRGLKKEEVSPGIIIASEEELFDCDAMFLCVAISSMEETLIKTKKYHNKKTTFFDTCSVKTYPVQWMLTHLPAESPIIATHPMFGPDSYCRNGEKMPLVMCKVRSEENVFKEWKNFFVSRNMRVEVMTADEHDRKVAYSQGITHYIGRVLADLKLEPNSISTVGYKKLLEIIQQTCNDNWQLFLDLQKYNPYTRQMRKDLHISLKKIYAVLEKQA